MIFGKKNKEKKEEKDRTDLRKSLGGWQARAVAKYLLSGEHFR